MITIIGIIIVSKDKYELVVQDESGNKYVFLNLFGMDLYKGHYIAHSESYNFIVYDSRDYISVASYYLNGPYTVVKI